MDLAAEAPVKPVPMVITDVPTVPLVGLNDVMVERAMASTVKFVALATVVPSLVTEIGPVVAPAGTMAVICEFRVLGTSHWCREPDPVGAGEAHAGDHDRGPDHAAGQVADVIAKPPAVTVKWSRSGRAAGVVTKIGPGRLPRGPSRSGYSSADREACVGVVELHRGCAEEARS